MAFLRDEKISDRSADRRAVSRRPVIIAAMVLAGVVGLVLAARGGSERPEEELPGEFVLEPDHAGAARTLAAAEASKAPQAPQKPAPVPAEGGNEEDLGVHPVPSLNGAGYDPAGAPVGGATTYLAAQQQVVDQHNLSTQQAELEARTTARNAPMRIASFTAHQQAQYERAAAFLSGAGGGGGGMGGALPGGLPNVQELASLAASPAMAALAGGRGGGVPGMPSMPQADPMLTANKEDFYQHGGDRLQPGRLQADVEMPESEFEVQMGSVIPGVLISGINAEVPGQIIGQVSEQVYDSATGRHLLIPQGSRLVGTYNATVANGQSRVQVAWTRLNFPDGRKLDLGGMTGTDQAGVSGFEDKINRHFGSRLAAALMTSAFTVAYNVAAPQNGGFYGNAVYQGIGQSIVQLGVDMARQEGQRPPTLEIRPGYRFSIAVSKDIVLPGPYEDGIQRRKVRR
jgi:type IV secretory pathway VirB10-like protein